MVIKKSKKTSKRTVRKKRIKRTKLEIIGCASNIAGADASCDKGVAQLRKSRFLKKLITDKLPIQWEILLKEKRKADFSIEQTVVELCSRLSKAVMETIAAKKPFLVIGGEHSCAIGTWSGVANAYKDKGDIGLIWIDAHMDSHTPETSHTQHIHGMPLAALLGYGMRSLTHLVNDNAKLKPRNVCLIGVRSFEAGEAALLKRLNVKVYFMDEVKERGFEKILQEAIKHVSLHTIGYGVTLDIDSLDPEDAPAVDVPEADGIRALEMVAGLKQIANDPRLLAAELVEFDPVHDKEHMTEKLIMTFIQVLAKGMIKKK